MTFALCKGLVHEIAAQLVIAAKTVRNHVTRIYRKLRLTAAPRPSS